MAKKLFVNEDLSSLKSKSDDLEYINFKNTDQAAEIINKWSSEATNGLISKLVDQKSIDNEIDILLLNSIYFSARWKHEFPDIHTTQMCFHNLKNECNDKIDFMNTIEDYNYAEIKEIDSKAVELDYQDETHSMIIVVPNQGSTIPDTIQKLLSIQDQNDNLLSIFDNKFTLEEVNLFLPKVKLEYERDVTQDLQKMGIKTVFTSESDLSNLIQGEQKTQKPLKISKVLQKSVLELTETGTKAASANLMRVVSYFGRTQVRFDINRPFFYFIRNKKNGEILFQGAFGQENINDNLIENVEKKAKVDLSEIIQNDGIVMSLEELTNSDDSIKFVHAEDETKNVLPNVPLRNTFVPRPFTKIFTIFWQTLDNKENDSKNVEPKLIVKNIEKMYGDAPSRNTNSRRNYRSRANINSVPNNYVRSYTPKFARNLLENFKRGFQDSSGLIFRD